MAEAYAVFVEGIESVDFAKSISKNISLAAQRAINKTVDTTRTLSAKRIREQVAFPANYLAPSGGRLSVVKKASTGDLSATIRGRFRPTSLARFVQGTPRRGQAVQVAVSPGMARFMRRAFLIKLPAGSTKTDTKFNLGLALRLKPGETIQNKREAIKMASGLYLLFGPSVDQVFRTVAQDVSGPAADQLETEFLRLLEI